MIYTPLSRSRIQVAAIAMLAVLSAVTFALISSSAGATSPSFISLYPSATTPTSGPDSDHSGVELGVKFAASRSGTIAGVRFYKYSTNTGTHVGTLWTSGGVRLASATFVSESSSGWQTVQFATPVAIYPNQSYVASYHATGGHYASKEGAFSRGATIGNSYLTASSGTYLYGSGGFPTSTWNASAYYVDVLFSLPTVTGSSTPVSTTPTPAPTTPTTTVVSSSSPTTTSPAPPPAGGFPDSTTTGWQHTGTTLTAYTGPRTITTDGTVISGKDVKTCLQILANNVTIKNSRIACASSGPTVGGNMVLQQGTAYASASGLILTDDEITRPAGSNGGADYAVLLYGSNVTMTRVDIHNVTSGVHFSGGSATITDSYIHDMVNISGRDHNDDVIANGYSSHVTLKHNTLEVAGAQTTPVAMYPEGQPNSYWTVDSNLLAGGGYCIYPSYTKGSEQPNNHITVTNNVFSRKFYPNCGAAGPVNGGPNGAHFSDGAGNVWSNNTWQGTTQLVPSG